MLRLAAIAVFTLTPPAVENVTYRVEPAESQLAVEVGRAGLFKLFGHDHRIEASGLSGEATWDAASPESARFVVAIDAASLRVADEEVSEEDRAAIQAEMETTALALSENPTIRFQSESVRVRGRVEGSFELEVEGTLSLRGVEKKLRVPFTLEAGDERLSARGELELESDAWGVPQISVAGGAVKTKKELRVNFRFVAVR